MTLEPLVDSAKVLAKQGEWPDDRIDRSQSAAPLTIMKIAVISDTHDRVPVGLPERLTDADEIWHLGDVCHPDTLLSIEALGIRMRIISGNCDYLNLWPGAMGITLGNLRFHLEHIAPRVAPPDTDSNGTGVANGRKNTGNDAAMREERT